MSEKKAVYDVGEQSKEKPWRCVCGALTGAVVQKNNKRALQIVGSDFTVLIYSGDVVCHKCGETKEFWDTWSKTFLICLTCGASLANILERDGKTVIHVSDSQGTHVTIDRALIKCPRCGSKRRFVSVPSRKAAKSDLVEITGGID